MDNEMSPTFVSYAADILANTNNGLSGPQFLKVTKAYGAQWGVHVPHPIYPFDAANKRTALFDNLMAFSPQQRYHIIQELCGHHTLLEKNPQGAEGLKVTLTSRYSHLVGQSRSAELDAALIQRTQHFLGPFNESLVLFESAVYKHASRVYLRNLLDDLRLSLELLLKSLLTNAKPLENQIQVLGAFLKPRGGSAELTNMFVKLVDYYTKYQNTYVKHDDAVIEEEVEFIFELTASFMKHLVRLSYRQQV